MYESDTKMAIKFYPVIALVNDVTGEIGVVRWFGTDNDQVESCKHEWWSRCHDAGITSFSRHYYFSNIVLVIGGRVFSIWNIEYKGGPIWWYQYNKEVTLTQGCFSPFHPGIFYIGRRDGKVDLWDIRKQIHKPAMKIQASGCAITILSVVTPPYSEHQISIADSDGNFHVLDHEYDSSWREEDLVEVARFFKQAEESRKQHHRWNRTWREQSTWTDVYKFEHAPSVEQPLMVGQRFQHERTATDPQLRENEREDYAKDQASLTEKLKWTNEYTESVLQTVEKMMYLKEELKSQEKAEIAGHGIAKDESADLGIDDIIAKYHPRPESIAI